jgi:hypothetical protein
MTYDQACYDLAATFIEDYAAHKNLNEHMLSGHMEELAKEIQSTIEDYINSIESE